VEEGSVEIKKVGILGSSNLLPHAGEGCVDRKDNRPQIWRLKLFMSSNLLAAKVLMVDLKWNETVKLPPPATSMDRSSSTNIRTVKVI